MRFLAAILAAASVATEFSTTAATLATRATKANTAAHHCTSTFAYQPPQGARSTWVGMRSVKTRATAQRFKPPP